MKPRAIVRLAVLSISLSMCLSTHSAQVAAAPLEKSNVTLAVGGTSTQLYFLPLILAQRLGYFENEGLKVELVDTGAGAKGLQALVSGGSDVTAGSFEHPIRMQARGQDVVAFVKFGRFHGNVLGILPKHAKDYKSPKDMKGWSIGVSAPGSSTHIFTTLLMAKNGLKPDDASFIALGQGPGGIAAVRNGKEIDAVSLTDPTISELERTKDIIVVADSRTLKGTLAAYGGETISGVLYTTGEFAKKNPNTVQALTNAIVRTLKWIKSASIDDIAAKMPESVIGGRPDFYKMVLKSNLENYLSDGTFSEEALNVTMGFLKKTDAELRDAKFDPRRSYDNTFAQKANADSGK